MLLTLKKFSTVVLSVMAFGFHAYGQVSGNSPYSRFGLGDLNNGHFVHLQGLGGLGAAYSDAYQTNLSNPASLGHLEATSFEVGFDASRAYLSSGEDKAQFWGGGLNYLSLSFPMLNPLNRVLDRKSLDVGWGMNLSLRPYSRVNATSSIQEDLENVGLVTREFQGSGALNQVAWGNGVRLKNLSLGLNLGYIFGQIRQERSVLYNSITLPLHIYSKDDFGFRGFTWNLGMQYEVNLNKGGSRADEARAHSLTLGLSLGTSTPLTILNDELRATREAAWGGLTDDGRQGSLAALDTISFLTGLKENTSLPASFQIGAVWKRGQKWIVGMNVAYANWSSFQSNALQGTLENTFQVGMGVEFTPDFQSYRYYHHRMKYRVGFTFGTDPRVIGDDQIKEYILNVGVGLPIVVRQVSFINLGIEYANRGVGLPITDNRLTFKAGVTLNNNLWFYKRKYN